MIIIAPNWVIHEPTPQAAQTRTPMTKSESYPKPYRGTPLRAKPNFVAASY